MEIRNSYISEPITAVEPVAAPQSINKYDSDRKNQTKPYAAESSNHKTWKYYSVTQIVLMETSVHDHLGRHINIYA